MSAVRSSGGKADRALGSALWKRGLRYRRKSRLPGKPDFVFASARVVVFVDGDFWHGRWLDERIARGDFVRNADYWIPKLQGNMERDERANVALVAAGWKVIRVWESDLQQNLVKIADEICYAVRVNQQAVAERAAASKRKSDA